MTEHNFSIGPCARYFNYISNMTKKYNMGNFVYWAKVTSYLLS